MTSRIWPSLFISHGGPLLAVSRSPAAQFLQELGSKIGHPKAILIVSGHWETDVPVLTAVPRNDTIHDFYNFPPELYRLFYPAPGSVPLAEHVSDLLCASGLASRPDSVRGLDHGAWIPLMLMYPQAQIPVVQLSVQSHLGPAHHLQIGRALESLRREGVLVIGSGAMTHNLRNLRRTDKSGIADADVPPFTNWMSAAILENRVCDLLAYRRIAPHAVHHHPSEEHILPLFVAIGAGGVDAQPERLHASTEYGAMNMDSYAFHPS